VDGVSMAASSSKSTTKKIKFKMNRIQGTGQAPTLVGLIDLTKLSVLPESEINLFDNVRPLVEGS